MNPYLSVTESLFEQQFPVDEFPAASASCGVLVAGYSFQPETCSAEPPADQVKSSRAAILYADNVVAATPAEDTESESRLGLIKCRKIFRSLVARFGGKFACYTGNFIIAEFGNVDTALQCAINVQIALGNQNAHMQHKHQIRYRLGIEVGKTGSADKGSFNHAVDLVAELEHGAHPGGIYISQLARESLRKQSAARFVSLGKRYPHDVAEPFEVFCIEMDRSMLIDISEINTDDACARLS